MSDRSTWDVVSFVLYVLAIAAAVVSIFYRPFLFGPVGALCAMSALIMSTQNRRLGSIAVSVVVVFWLIGASYAVWNSNPLY
jgi:hypothetical protein